jgi:tripartite-type tricarboxylate transporter receptor subunit TctC
MHGFIRADKKERKPPVLKSFSSLLAAVLSLAVLVPAAVQAQAWPSRPVRIVVSYPAGGSLDAITRPFAEALSKQLGQPFVIENRAGAAGSLGTEMVAKSTADGYTLLGGPNAPLVLLPQLRKTPYAAADFIPVAPMGEFVYALGVLPKLGIDTLPQLIEHAKKNPGKLSYSSPGMGSATNLRGEALKVQAGVDILHVPYRTGAEALVDFLSGNVDIIIDNVQFPHVKAGKAKLLAVTASRRHPDFPDVPTMAEVGYDVGMDTFAALYAPKGTPQEVLDKLSATMSVINKQPEIQQRVLTLGFFPMDVPGSELTRRLDAQVKEFDTWVKKTNLKLE